MSRPLEDVLFGAPGARPRTGTRVASWLAGAALLALAAVVVVGFGSAGQLDARLWRLFTQASTWTFLADGLLGTLLVVGSYFLMQAGRLGGTSLAYQLANIAGSTGILVSLVGGFNVSVALLQCTWIVISLYGIWRAWRARRVTRDAATR